MPLPFRPANLGPRPFPGSFPSATLAPLCGSPARVLILGGGPTGLSAARTLAAQDHRTRRHLHHPPNAPLTAVDVLNKILSKVGIKNNRVHAVDSALRKETLHYSKTGAEALTRRPCDYVIKTISLPLLVPKLSPAPPPEILDFCNYLNTTCELGGDNWQVTDAVKAEIMREFEIENVCTRAQIKEWHVLQAVHGYPIFKLGSEPHFQSLKATADAVPNFLQAGRQGAFCYPNMLGAMRQGANAAKAIHQQIAEDRHPSSARPQPQPQPRPRLCWTEPTSRPLDFSRRLRQNCHLPLAFFPETPYPRCHVPRSLAPPRPDPAAALLHHYGWRPARGSPPRRHSRRGPRRLLDRPPLFCR